MLNYSTSFTKFSFKPCLPLCICVQPIPIDMKPLHFLYIKNIKHSLDLLNYYIRTNPIKGTLSKLI